MIVEFFLNMLEVFLISIVDLIPTKITATIAGFNDFGQLIRLGLSVFPRDVWIATITSFIAWTTLQQGWAVVEWLYKKIPGIN